MWKLILVLVLALLLGCGREVSNAPTVQLDASFGEDAGAVLAGVESWERAGVRPRVTLVGHDELVLAARAPVSDTVYVLRVNDMSECPELALPGGAQTLDAHDGYAVTCLNTAYLHRYPDDGPGRSQIKRASAHEFGHALGLAHIDDASALMLNSYGGADTPSCADYRSLADIRDSQIPEECR